MSQEICDQTTDKISNFLSCFPRTIPSAVGINFSFAIPDSEIDISEKFPIYEGLSSFERISQTIIQIKYQINEETVLNLGQIIDDDIVRLDFNFHTQVDSIESIIKQKSKQKQYLDDYSMKIISEIMEVSADYEVLCFPNEDGGGS